MPSPSPSLSRALPGRGRLRANLGGQPLPVSHFRVSATESRGDLWPQTASSESFHRHKVERPQPRRHELALDAQQQHRSEEHTSEPQSLMRISSAVFCLKKQITTYKLLNHHSKPH